jgi:hypothetical protein
MALQDRDDLVGAARRLQRYDITRPKAPSEQLKRRHPRRDPPRRPNPAFFGDRNLAKVAMHIQSEPAHQPSSC